VANVTVAPLTSAAIVSTYFVMSVDFVDFVDCPCALPICGHLTSKPTPVSSFFVFNRVELRSAEALK
jgi:hypothetical protein